MGDFEQKLRDMLQQLGILDDTAVGRLVTKLGEGGAIAIAVALLILYALVYGRIVRRRR